jgi:hypothetical protein
VGAATTIALATAVLGSAANGQENDLPLDPEWVANTVSRAAAVNEVKNNTIPGAIERRDKASADWKAAVKAYEDKLAQARAAKGAARTRLEAEARRLYPDPKAKPEYSVVWAAKQNAGDVNADVLSKFVQNATINPQGLLELAGPQFLPGLDGFVVLDLRKLDVDGSRNRDYGKVVNFVQLPLPWGVETEAHHMQYQWEDGDPIVAGGLFNGATFVLDAKDVPNLKLTNTIGVAETPLGSIPDAYDGVGDGRFIGTHMGGPDANFGGSPGSVFTLKPDPVKGLVLESETPAGAVGGITSGNANGVPEPCSVREARPLGTCANPHGIEIRKDIDTMVTADYAEPREIVLDPVKTVDKYTFRPTVRTWDVSDPAKPVLKSVGHVPKGWRKPAQRAHENYGIMEAAKTWPSTGNYAGTLDSKGFFAASMCGGGVFFVPDGSKLSGDASKDWVQVWDDGISQVLNKDSSVNEFLDEPGGCAGGAWHQVSRNNKWFFRSVQGRNPGADNYFDSGSTKMVYNLDIQDLIRSAADGKVQCDLARGVDVDGNGSIDLEPVEAVQKLAQGEAVADCPRYLDSVEVKDITTGGPHWGALDNHSTVNGFPTRLTFSNYFVSRTGVDGDHRFYTLDVDPVTGQLEYDRSFRDETTGALGVNFNRRSWPGSPDAGFYKPHSMIWVCPPGICPRDREVPAPPAAKAKAAPLRVGFVALQGMVRRLSAQRSLTIGLRKLGGPAVRDVQVTVRDRAGRVVARSNVLRSLAGRRGKVTLKRTGRVVRGRSYQVTVTGKTAAGVAAKGRTRTIRT